MPTICYQEHRFGADALLIIQRSNAIIAEYTAQGYALSLRQLYYVHVSRDYIPNNMRSYKRLGEIINNARLAGRIDWDVIEDRTRSLRSVSHWRTPEDIMRSAAASFRLDKWRGQPYRINIFIEKDALGGIVDRVATELDVPWFSCRGYTSQSEMWGAAMRLRGYQRAGQTPVILHLGDHDPSGKDMTRDITDRLSLFMGGCEVDRLALNMDQIEQYNPPPNPAKMTDCRAEAYVAEFGEESWELDALPPEVLADLIRAAVLSRRDEGRWAAAVEEENTHRAHLEDAAERWEDVTEWLAG